MAAFSHYIAIHPHNAVHLWLQKTRRERPEEGIA